MAATIEEYMEVVNWLNGYRKALNHIERLEEEIKRWRSKAVKTTPTMSLASGGSYGGGMIPNAIEMIEKTEIQLESAKVTRDSTREQIENAIFSLEDDKQQEVLYKLYIQHFRQKEVAHSMHYSQRQVYRIHLAGLEHLKDVRQCPQMSGDVR